MIAELIATGDEIRTGALVDGNSAYIADALERAGVRVTRHQCVGDHLETLVALFREVSARAELAVVTGGLGPTLDDLTAEAAASAAGVPLVEDEDAMEEIQAYFDAKGWPMTPSNRKQALLPAGSRRLSNPVGTAPGIDFTVGRCRFFCLPGVPAEMRRMLKDRVLPAVEQCMGQDRPHRLVRQLSTFGLGESVVGERLAGFARAFPRVRLGFRAGFPEIHVRLYTRGETEEAAEENLRPAVDWVAGRMGIHLVSDTGLSLAAVLGRRLVARGATLAVAESCTGGLIASRLTDVPGSSAFFLFSGVTYSNDAKMRVLGVSADTLERFGAVSEACAEEMAEGARRIAGADYGLSTSGIAGPDGGTPEKPVGTVCIGLSDGGESSAVRLRYPFDRRLLNKSIFAAAAMDLLRRKLAEPTE